MTSRGLYLSLAVLALGCTLNVQNVSRTATSDTALSFSTFHTDLRALGFVGGGLHVRGADRVGGHAALTVAGLLPAGGSPDAIDRGIGLAWDASASPLIDLDVAYHGPAVESLSLQDLDVELPRACAVDVESDDASVDVTDIDASVRVRTASASILVRGASATDLASENGEIDVAATSAIVRSGAGSVVLDLGGDVDVQTVTGSVRGSLRDGGSVTCGAGGAIRIDLLALASDLDLGTENGAIELHVPADASLDLDVATAGTIHVLVGTVAYDGTGTVTRRLGAGGPLVHVHSHAGSVRVVAL